MLIKATDKFEKENIKDKEIGKIRKQGEIWEVSDERAKLLIEKGFANEESFEQVKAKKKNKK